MKAIGDAMGDAAGYTSQYGFELYDTAGHDRGRHLRGDRRLRLHDRDGPAGRQLPHALRDRRRRRVDRRQRPRPTARAACARRCCSPPRRRPTPPTTRVLTGTAPAGPRPALCEARSTRTTSPYCEKGVEPVDRRHGAAGRRSCPGGMQDPQTLHDTLDIDDDRARPAARSLARRPVDAARSWAAARSSRSSTDVDPPIATFTGGARGADRHGRPRVHAHARPDRRQGQDRAARDPPEDYDLEVLRKTADGR